jgi:hypothetical protein
VDGVISDGLNGKNCQSKLSRKFIMLCAPCTNTSNKLFSGPIVTLSLRAQLSKLLIKPIKTCTDILMLLTSMSSCMYNPSIRKNCTIQTSMSCIGLFRLVKTCIVSDIMIVSHRIFNIPPVYILTLFCNSVTVTRCASDLMMTLLILWLVCTYEIISILPHIKYLTLRVNMVYSRLNRYRE